MPTEMAHHRGKATILGLALAMPLLAACAYDDGYYGAYDDYYGPPADYGYGYVFYGYSYGYPCSWRYDCSDWGHRHRHRHHRHHGDDDDDDGKRHRGERGVGNRPAVDPDDHASDVPRRPRIVMPRDSETGGFARRDRRSSSPNPFWIPTGRESKR